MTHLKQHRLALILLIALLAIGIVFLPAYAFADDSTSSSTTSTTIPDFVPSTTVLPLLGSNITIELATDGDGVVSNVTVDGELVDHELEMEDGEIKIEFRLTNDQGTFEVEVKFEDDDLEIEIESDDPATPGDYLWSGESCEGNAISIAYTVAEDGSLTLGAITGDVDEVEADGEDIEVRFTDGTEVEFESESDEFEIEQSCHDGSDDDEFDDDDSYEDDDDDSDDHDSDDDHDDDDDDDEDDE